MRRRPLRARLGVVTAVGAAALAVLASFPLVDATPAGAATATDATVRVLSVSPAVPPSTVDVTPLTVTLSLTNNSAATLHSLRLDITREPPIANTDDLRAELANPVESKSQPFRLPSQTIDGDLAPKASRTVTVSLTTSTDSTVNTALCLCRTGVYPLDFALHAASGTTTATPELGWAQTYIPSSGDAQMQVSWLWPFIDRPHRSTSDSTFVDDDLTASVSSGGRLDRALASLERAKSLSQVTLVLDPELLDELIVMSEGYHVTSNGTTTVGTGGRAAAAWLGRFKTVLGEVGGYSLTPYADPDVDALTRAGLTWASAMPAPMAQRLFATLGITEQHPIAWPAGQTITADALTRVVADGAQTVLLDDASMPGSSASSGGHVQLAGSKATALVESRNVISTMNAVIDANGRGASAVPAFVSSVLMPALDETNNFMVLAPDQLVDADPAAAAAAIDDTAGGPFIPITVGDALANVDSYDGGDLTQPSTAGDDELPAGQLTTARAAVASTASLSGTLTPADAATLLGGFPAAIQRSESSAWRSDRAAGEDFANSIAATATDLTNKIKIVPPKNGSYSLASSDSPLILTVQNTLTSPVSVRVAVSSVGDVKGFTAQTSEVLEIPAGEQRTVRVQAHVDRSGHFKVMAALTSPSGSPVGEPARLTIYSKALGTIGIMITVVAGSVLAVALLIRFSRRFQARRKRRAAEALVAAGRR